MLKPADKRRNLNPLPGAIAAKQYPLSSATLARRYAREMDSILHREPADEPHPGFTICAIDACPNHFHRRCLPPALTQRLIDYRKRCCDISETGRAMIDA